MKKPKDNLERINRERALIFETIDASIELAERKGKHPLERGCVCVSCVKKRKRLIEGGEREWRFRL